MNVTASVLDIESWDYAFVEDNTALIAGAHQLEMTRFTFLLPPDEMGSIPKAQILSYKKQSHTYQNLGGGINLTRPWGINPPAPRFWAWGDQSPKAWGDQSP